MEITGTLISGKTTDIDLTPIFYANMISVYDFAAIMAPKSDTHYTYPTPQDHWKYKKVTFSIDVSTNDDWDMNNAVGFAYQYGYGSSRKGGYIEYDFTKNDVYCSSPSVDDPPYFVDDCVTLFYYTNNSNNDVIDSSVQLYFPPVICYQALLYDPSLEDDWYVPTGGLAIKTFNTSISTKTVTLQTHPYASSGYSFGENSGNFNVSSASTYTWKDYSGNCVISYNPSDGLYPNASNPPSTYNATAPKFTIGFRKNGLSFFSRDGIKCYSQYATPSTYEGWVELIAGVNTTAQITDGQYTHTGGYKVKKLKIRIIKVLLSDEAGEQKFFIGSKYPTEIYLTNSNSTLVPVKEVWLGNVKVWPCGFDFNNPDAKTNADFRFKLKCEGFNFYLSTDPNTKVGDGITDGSVFVSVGFEVEKTGSTGGVYNAHQASIDNSRSVGDSSTCKVAKYFTSPRPDNNGTVNAPDGTVNTRLELTCGSESSPFYITFDAGNDANLKHTSDNCGNNSNCSTFFKNIDPFTPVTLYFYFCCPHPTLPTSSSNYYFTGTNGYSTAKDIKGNNDFSSYQMKLGPTNTKNKYNMIEIYRLASKPLMSEANIIYQGARVNNWKNSPGSGHNKIINTYPNDASTNNADVCKGYLNTLKKGPFYLGGISNSVTVFPFVINVYVAPKKETNPNNPVNPGTVGSSLYDPYIISGECKKISNQYDSTLHQLYGYSVDTFTPGASSGTPHHSAWISSGDNFESLYSDTSNGNIRIGIKLIYPNNTDKSSTGYTQVRLYIAKNCHTQSVTETFGGHLWNGNYEQALNIIDYYGVAPSGKWETGTYTIPSSDSTRFYSRACSVRYGSYSLVSNTNYGKIEINITISQLLSCGSVTYTAFVGGGPHQSISTAFVTFDYVYTSVDSVEVSINQRPLEPGGFKTSVVAGVVSSFGGYSYSSY